MFPYFGKARILPHMVIKTIHYNILDAEVEAVSSSIKHWAICKNIAQCLFFHYISYKIYRKVFSVLIYTRVSINIYNQTCKSPLECSVISKCYRVLRPTSLKRDGLAIKEVWAQRDTVGKKKED